MFFLLCQIHFSVKHIQATNLLHRQWWCSLNMSSNLSLSGDFDTCFSQPCKSGLASLWELVGYQCMYIWGFRTRQHLRSVAPIMSDYDDQMIFGEVGGLMLPNICLTGEEKPWKTSLRKLVPTGDWTRACYMTDAHATAWSTVVDLRASDLHERIKMFRDQLWQI